jgi:hypothetical protein
MAATMRVNLLAIGLAFVRLRPKTSAAIAFELGLLAAHAVRASRARQIPSKFIELAPSIGDLGGFLDRRRRTKASAPRKAKKPAAKRASRKKVTKVNPPPPAQMP